ncbi:bifunctional hydroxymethylpyrimidine kinase/phosphomethylpyrimidine kinase [Insolitispirillum peregrinum]|uniref:hydroxymethylpyrimidine kinase n=1 Tax=Insolitispirillum peregrinum TaxID=80876 RepID=A0A1N7IQT8_9PROT|nr:bifunctional hydroxymethylpyrimidine kinase/phosphomethylpyrimidine kinase [Insolitispirillum peregrinum]SIS39444.1 hydroxymethylpyrimidine/phosphomethylpyrimidine kinase [Insolitispirillum peregrinum]
MKGKVLIIAGSDSGGGAGIQADIKAVTCLGGFAMTAITALTAQNTLGVHGVHPVPEAFIRQQIQVVMEDLGANAIKIGMLATRSIIATVAQALADFAPDVPVVLDTVMVAKGGHPLLEPEAVEALKAELLPRATVITPNLPEAGVLIGQTLTTEQDMEAALPALEALAAQAVLLKGGHLEGDTLLDMLVTADSLHRFTDTRLETRHTHGTGCTLASAIACGLAQGLPLVEAVVRARAYVRRAIELAPGYGNGHGPLNHAHTVRANPEQMDTSATTYLLK